MRRASLAGDAPNLDRKDERTLPVARTATTLPEGRPARQSENSQTRTRNAAVRAVLADKRLTYGCKSFYCLIDQHYGWKNGLVCPKLRTLVLRFGLCRRSCQRWFDQLRECGYLVTEARNGRACRHRLTWAQSVAPEAAAVSPHGLINANEENIESAGVGVDSDTHPTHSPAMPGDSAGAIPARQHPNCPQCHGTHYRTVVEWVRAGKQRHCIEKRVLCRCG